MLSTQLTVSQILQMLTQNPNTGVFALQTSDYPTGVTRAALIAALNAQLGSGNFDSVKGTWNSAVYAPGILLNGGGTQIPATPSANMNAPATAPQLPIINPVGASAAGASVSGITNPTEVQ
jgi:hypothetical protein